jgi:hypothetical protein
MVIDTIDPQIVSVTYDSGQSIHELSRPFDNKLATYYDADQTATITVKEHNFRPDDVVVKVTAKDVSGQNVGGFAFTGDFVKDYADQAVVRSEWDLSGADWRRENDTYILTASYDRDANYTFDVEYRDLALREIADYTEDVFTVDKVTPANLDVAFSETVAGPFLESISFGFYQAQMRVTITASDGIAGVYRYLYSYAKSEGVSSVNAELLNEAINNADVSYSDDNKTATASFTIPKSVITQTNQFNGTVSFVAYDRSENNNDTHDPRTVVLDNMRPTREVTFSTPVQTVNNISYYGGAATGTIRINEANFYAEDVVVQVNGSRTTPGNWTQSGDVWTSSITLGDEGDYKVAVNYTDRSGNVMEPFESNQLTVDTTVPVITVGNIKHESANNAETVGFNLTVTDRNIGAGDVAPNFTAVIKQNDTYVSIPVDIGAAGTSTNGSGDTVYTYTVDNLEADGFYSLSCVATDYAANKASAINAEGAAAALTTEAVQFSVNREGSAFWIETTHDDKYTSQSFSNELDKQYANDIVKVVLHEVNVDTIDVTGDDKPAVTINDGSQSISVDLNDGNFDANRTPASRTGEGGWYENIYTLATQKDAKGTYSQDFDHDGTYSLNVVTHDRAANNNVNTKEEGGATIGFVVDRTVPVITSNVNSKQRINASDFDVEFKVTDANFDADTLAVKLQGKTIKPESLGNNEYRFNVSGAFQSFDIEAKDMAGNPAELYTVDRLTVSTNAFVLWYANTVLFWSSIGGALLLAGLIIFFIFFKRRKKEEAQKV